MNIDFLQKLQNFVALDKNSFQQLMQKLGFFASACYRLRNDQLTCIFTSLEEYPWPISVAFNKKDYPFDKIYGFPSPLTFRAR